MKPLYEYEYEIDGKIVYFFDSPTGYGVCCRVNNKATYRKPVPDGPWMCEGHDPGRNNKLTSQEIESVWERHIGSLIVDGEPKRWDPWRKEWVTGEESG